MSRAVREAWLALLGWIAVAAALTWPTLRHPASTIPADLGDPLLQAWQLAWGGHALLHQPAHPFDSNTFFPLPNSLAFSDSLLGWSPVAAVFGAGPAAALVRYNVVFVLACAVCGWGSYLLARQLGLRRAGAVVAGLVLCAAPWRAAQAGHLQILSCGGVPLALALLARGHGLGAGGRGRPSLDRARPWCAAAGFAVAGWQTTMGFGVGLQAGYLLGLVVVGALVVWVLAGRPPVPRRLAWADAAGLSAYLAVAVACALPYLRAAREHPESVRTEAVLGVFSPPAQGFITPPATSWLWGGQLTSLRSTLAFPPEMTLGLGGTAVVLAVLGASACGAWSARRRVVLAGAVVTLLIFALGTRGPFGGRLGYLVLFHHAPGFAGIRTPGRLVVTATVLLALLAAAGAQVVADAVGRRHAVLGTAAGLVLAGLVLAEGADNLAHPRPPAAPAQALRTGSGPLIVLPSDDAGDEDVMWWSTDGFPWVVNGISGFTPTVTSQIRSDALAVLSGGGAARLRAAGVRRVVVLLGRYGPEVAAAVRGSLPAGVARVEVPADDAVVLMLGG